MPEKHSCLQNPLWLTILLVFTIGLLLAACRPGSPEQLPAPTLPASATPSPTATLTPTATPIIEPVLPVLSADAELAVEPPDFNLPPSASGAVNSTFDLINAHAVYAYYRQQESPSIWANDAEFTSAMQSYMESLTAQGINLEQVTVEGQTFFYSPRATRFYSIFLPTGRLKILNPVVGAKTPRPSGSMLAARSSYLLALTVMPTLPKLILRAMSSLS